MAHRPQNSRPPTGRGGGAHQGQYYGDEADSYGGHGNQGHGSQGYGNQGHGSQGPGGYDDEAGYDDVDAAMTRRDQQISPHDEEQNDAMRRYINANSAY